MRHLAEEHAVPPEAVRRLIDDALTTFADARVRDFVPVLIEKEARGRLRRAGAPKVSSTGHQPDT